MRRASAWLLAGGLLAGTGWVAWRYFPDALPTWASTHLPRSPLANPPLYKWRDAQGRWHVTDRPPDGLPFEEVRVDPAANVVPGPPQPE